ncbi:unnamed protein product [Triticum turgidum subsp. durum]|uniref:non-specific serine/threonine protein kinase n=1 Tax=Triticum turgidum subsp. durum TaxID=4567 RepID=A0A9R1AD54_TRITD|nr:unnamed protein product [Triticum turgidum subsp. durum]
MAMQIEELRIESSDLRRITNDFSDAKKIGCGGYGDVYKADYNGEEIAVKLLDPTKGIDDQQFMKELYNHMEVKHRNIVRLVGYCNEEIKKYVEQKVGPPVFGKHIYKVLCFEYMRRGSLDKHLSENSLGDDWRTHYQIIKGTCEGLWYLHNGLEHRILHLDLKPGNILLDDYMEPKIADFGLSRIYTSSRSNTRVKLVSGTTKYMPPELRRGSEISEKTDTYGLGVTIIDVIRGSVGFELYHELEATRFVENVRTYWGQRDGTAHLDQVEECTKIAIRCIRHDRRNRPTIKEIVADLNATETQILAEGPRALTISSSRGKLGSLHVPDKLSSSTSGRGPLDVVIVYAFDCYLHTPAWYTMNDWVFWLVQEKLTHFVDSCLGYVMLTPNECISGMKLVESADTKASGYTDYDRRSTKRKTMASGLEEAHNIISNRGHHNSIILFFSDGLVNNEYFFHGNENFISQVPVHTFTLGGNAYNHILHSIAANSPGGKFHSTSIPERPNVSTAFSRLLDKLLGDASKDDAKPPSTFSGRGPLDVVIVFAFDRTNSTAQTRYTVAHGVFWLLQEKLTRFVDSCLGYIYVMSTPKTYTYTLDMKLVYSKEKKDAPYTVFNERTRTCTKNMASGLAEAHNMIKNRGHHNGIIFLFSDGLINKGDFFDGTDNYVSEVPVHTFTLGGDTYNHGLQAISANSPGGTFNSIPVPEKPLLSEPFSTLLDGLLSRTIVD